jgi:hypothetical protein
MSLRAFSAPSPPARPPVGSPPVAVSPQPQSAYARIGTGHWIDEVSNNGRFITLEDGSLWDVQSIDQVDTALWLPITDITVRLADHPIGGCIPILQGFLTSD